jgi:hypothetical protein
MFLFFACVWLALAVGPGRAGAQNGPDKGSFSKPSLQFADTDRNGVIDLDESKFFRQGKSKVFDTDHNGVLDEKETAAFNLVDKKLSSGGAGLQELDDRQRTLYRQWRDFILTLQLKSEELAHKDRRVSQKPHDQGAFRKKALNSDKSAKCFPDKVCDDPQSPEYGSGGIVKSPYTAEVNP